MNAPASQSLLIVAGEASSALYAERLLEYWQTQEVPLNCFGIGSGPMVNLGFEAIGRSEELAVVGISEVVRHFGKIWQVFHGLLEEAAKRKPKAALLLDYPDFNLRLARKLKALKIPVFYYISPQVWAWRTSRVHLIKEVVDQMLVVFPFEVEFYQRYQIPVTFVGHPLLDELHRFETSAPPRFAPGKYQDHPLTLGLMPGSRHSELKHHLEIQLETVREIICLNKSIKVKLLLAPSLKSSDVAAAVGQSKLPIEIIQGPPFQMIDQVDLVLCASGTATLMVGLLLKPMVIMYRMNPLTAFFARRLVTQTRFFGMVNLILGKEVARERFQEQAVPGILAQDLNQLISSNEELNRVREELKGLRTALGEGGATTRVGKIIAEFYK